MPACDVVYDIIQTVGNLLQGVEKCDTPGMPRQRAIATRRPCFVRCRGR